AWWEGMVGGHGGRAWWEGMVGGHGGRAWWEGMVGGHGLRATDRKRPGRPLPARQTPSGTLPAPYPLRRPPRRSCGPPGRPFAKWHMSGRNRHVSRRDVHENRLKRIHRSSFPPTLPFAI